MKSINQQNNFLHEQPAKLAKTMPNHPQCQWRTSSLTEDLQLYMAIYSLYCIQHIYRVVSETAQTEALGHKERLKPIVWYQNTNTRPSRSFL